MRNGEMYGRFNDQQLMQMAQGDRHAFDELFKRHLQHITAICQNMLGKGRDVEDTANGVLQRAWEKRGLYECTGEVAAWLEIIAKRYCLDLLDRKGPPIVPNTEGDPAMNAIPDPRSEPATNIWPDVEQQLKIHLTKQEDRVICRLKYNHGLTNPEIAQVLEMKKEKLKDRIDKIILPAMREILMDYLPPDSSGGTSILRKKPGR